MNKTRWSWMVALVAVAGLTGTAQAQQLRSAKVAQCSGLQAADVAAQVKRDFLQNRITRWDADKKQLGTATPIVWVSPDAIVGKDNVWQVPLTVRGSKMDKIYNVTLNCNQGEIAYSVAE
ncbi:TPA: hypothetical protein SLG40_000056 [Serratia odorifera]|nr:hypothetical protein [Serratia odorifera]